MVVVASRIGVGVASASGIRPGMLPANRRRHTLVCIVGKKRKHRHPHSHPPHNHRRPLTMARRRPRLADSPFFSPEGVTWQFTGTALDFRIGSRLLRIGV